MSATHKHIVIIAGEASGDMHAAHLVKALKQKNPSLTFSGLGGPKMQNQEVEIYTDLTKIAVVGFAEVLKHYGEIRAAFHLILKKIKETKADAVILVDYPGFNLRLAKKLKKEDIKVIYYISPQVWAWKENRVHQIKKYVDQMLVIFQFEKDFYAKFGMAVDFVGHPLMDTIQIHQSKEEFLSAKGLQDDKTTIGILPGSRQKEIERHLPVMLETAAILSKEFPMLQFLIIKAESISKELIEKYTQKFRFNFTTIDEQHYDGVNACDLCMVSSGTATLEVAILQKPMVVIYKTSWITWALAKLFVKIPNIGLVNVVAGKRIVPECIQHRATPQTIANELKNIFTNESTIVDIHSKLRTVKESLGESGASSRAAEKILDII